MVLTTFSSHWQFGCSETVCTTCGRQSQSNAQIINYQDVIKQTANKSYIITVNFWCNKVVQKTSRQCQRLLQKVVVCMSCWRVLYQILSIQQVKMCVMKAMLLISMTSCSNIFCAAEIQSTSFTHCNKSDGKTTDSSFACLTSMLLIRLLPLSKRLCSGLVFWFLCLQN